MTDYMAKDQNDITIFFLPFLHSSTSTYIHIYINPETAELKNQDNDEDLEIGNETLGSRIKTFQSHEAL
jgi:hypothetical protein